MQILLWIVIGVIVLATEKRKPDRRKASPLSGFPFFYLVLWQAPAIGQLPQPHPQEDFPFLLSRRSVRTAAATMPASAIRIFIVRLLLLHAAD